MPKAGVLPCAAAHRTINLIQIRKKPSYVAMWKPKFSNINRAKLRSALARLFTLDREAWSSLHILL
jgi:hypothetical protein